MRLIDSPILPCLLFALDYVFVNFAFHLRVPRSSRCTYHVPRQGATDLRGDSELCNGAALRLAERQVGAIQMSFRIRSEGS